MRIDYPHLGQPDGLTQRAASGWRRSNTYYIANGERIRPAVVADPPDCFTPHEWQQYLSTLPLGGYRLPNSPNNVGRTETEAEVIARQARGARAAACDDCLLFYQLDQRSKGRCHPPKYAITPISRLMESEHMEGNSVTAPRGGTGTSDVPLEARLLDGEVR